VELCRFFFPVRRQKRSLAIAVAMSAARRSSSTPSRLDIINYSEHPAVKKYELDTFHYGAEMLTHMPLPTRVIFCGGSNSGKTNAAFNMAFRHMACFERAYIIAQDSTEPKYKAVMDDPAAFSPTRGKMMEVLVSDELEDWEPCWAELQTETNAREIPKIVLFDDQLGERANKAVLGCFNRGRKFNLTSFFITSSMADTDGRLKNNFQFVCIFHQEKPNMAEALLRTYKLPSSVMDLYLDITSNVGEWLMIDCTPAADKNPALKLRRCYTPIGDSMKLAAPRAPPALAQLEPPVLKRAPRKGKGKKAEERDEWDSQQLE
jgi:hypothetical protein